jgi:ABC-type branched-subunit amino acid transport system substrate-binding protein
VEAKVADWENDVLKEDDVIKRALVILATGVLLLSVAAGCGGGDDDGTDSTDAAAKIVPPDPSLPTLKVGIIGPTNNPESDIYDGLAALQAAARGWNSRGGLHGHEVEVVYCNDKADVNEGTACARKMVSEGVFAVVGGSMFGGFQANPILLKANIPQVGLLPFSEVEYEAENVYLLGDTFTGLRIAALVAAQEGQRLALVTQDSPTSTAWADSVEGEIEEAGGAVTSKIAVPVNTTDFAPIVQAALKDDPDGAWFILRTPQENAFMRQAMAVNADFKYFIASAIVPTDIETLGGPILDKVIDAAPFPSIADEEDPIIQQMRADLAAEEEAGNDDASLDGITKNYAMNAYFSAYALEQITEGMSEITAENVKTALDEARDIDFQGSIPAWTPGNPGPPGYTRVSNTARLIHGYDEEGRFRPLTDGYVTFEQAKTGDFTLTPLGDEFFGSD